MAGHKLQGEKGVGEPDAKTLWEEHCNTCIIIKCYDNVR